MLKLESELSNQSLPKLPPQEMLYILTFIVPFQPGLDTD